MKTRFILLLTLLFAMALVLVACENETVPPSTTAATESPTDPVESPTEKDTTEEPTAPVETPTDDVTTEPAPSVPSVIEPLSPTHGATVCVANTEVAEYAANYTIGGSLPYRPLGNGGGDGRQGGT